MRGDQSNDPTASRGIVEAMGSSYRAAVLRPNRLIKRFKRRGYKGSRVYDHVIVNAAALYQYRTISDMSGLWRGREGAAVDPM